MYFTVGLTALNSHPAASERYGLTLGERIKTLLCLPGGCIGALLNCLVEFGILDTKVFQARFYLRADFTIIETSPCQLVDGLIPHGTSARQPGRLQAATNGPQALRQKVGGFRIGESSLHNNGPSNVVRPRCFDGALLNLQGLRSRGFATRQGSQAEAVFSRSLLPIAPL